MSAIIRAYKYALDPTPSQVDVLQSHVGASRFAYNFLLGKIKAVIEQRKCEESYGITEDDLIPFISTSHYALRKYWNTKKCVVAPWWDENSKEAYSDGAKRLSISMSGFFASNKGKRKGPKMGFPQFHKRGSHESCRFTTGVMRVESDRKHITLPTIGRIKTHESTRKLARRVENKTARILAATLTQSGGKWFVVFTCEVEQEIVQTREHKKIVGVDVGITTLYKVVDTDGNLALDVENPKHTKSAEIALRRAQRMVSRKMGPKPGVKASKRWIKANKRVTNIHRDTANRRADLINKTTTHLAKTCDVIVIESLNVKGMLKNRYLSKAISDAAWGEFVRQLKYKTTWYGSTLIQVSKWLPSSKTCSNCGEVKATLLLSEREYVCTNCGLVIDRDHNAALNLAKLGLVEVIAGSISVTGRGGLNKPEVSISAQAAESSILQQPTKVA